MSKKNCKVVVLTGAGQSANLGFLTLKEIIDSQNGIKLSLNANQSEQIIRATWRLMQGLKKGDATFEDVIRQIKKYIEVTKTLTNDTVYIDALSQIGASVRSSSNLGLLWEDALSECYKIMLDNYGPHKAIVNNEAYRQAINLLKQLTEINGGSLLLFTTNYDCGFNVIATKTRIISFKSHINSSPKRKGQFDKDWYNMSTGNKPCIYLNRLHGCVAWFCENGLPYNLREASGAGDVLGYINLPSRNQIVIKLVSEEEIGKNPAFNLAFEEFHDALKFCEILFVWGHSLRDIEVISTIQRVFESRSNNPFKILILDPYLTINKAKDNMRETLLKTTMQVHNIGIEIVPYEVKDGSAKMVVSTIKKIKEMLKPKK